MSKNFKPLFEQVAVKLAAELKEGTSALQKPLKDNGIPAFIKPVNPFSGKGYSVLNALNLHLQKYDDPRWASANEAGYHKHPVQKGEKGTLINFPKKSDIEAIRAADGGKIKDDAGKTQTRTVEFDKPQKGVGFLFNVAQLKDFPPLGDFLEKQNAAEKLSPNERAEKLIADSGAVIIHGGEQAYYDKQRDAIFMPEKEQFENETKYYQAAIHQLAHWSGHESRQIRSMEGKFGSMEYGKEEFRAALTAMLVGAELKIGNHFPHHANYSGGWAKMLKDTPFEMFRAAADVQKMTSLLLGHNRNQEQSRSQDPEKVSAPSKGLKKGDAVAYNDTTYHVVDKKGKTLTIEKEDTREKFKVKTDDNLYTNLVGARDNPVAKQKEQGIAHGTQHDAAPEIAVENEQTYKIGR